MESVRVKRVVKPWSEEDVWIAYSRRLSNFNTREIGEKIGRSKAAVNGKFSAMNIYMHCPPGGPPASFVGRYGL